MLSFNAGAATLAGLLNEKYEQGQLNIRISVLIELRKIYQCTYDDFFEGLDKTKE